MIYYDKHIQVFTLRCLNYMGICRCLAKPCKRWAFAKADKIAQSNADKTLQKYSLKFKKKLQKMGRADDVELFKRALKYDLDAEKNIAHSKVREYWLLRGPRLFLLTLFYICINLSCSEVFKSEPEPDRLYIVCTSAMLLLISAYMLFFRLHDAIHASMARIGHRHYTEWKRSQAF